jgi:small GTP-binding protein
MKTYNIAFLGAPGVGKTSAIKALKGVWYASAPYVATMGIEVHPMSLTVKGEKVTVNLWDISGKHPGRPEGIWREQPIHATCLFFDSTSPSTLQSALYGWTSFAQGPCSFVATKIDCPTYKPSLIEFAFLRTKQEPFKITAKNPVGIEEMLGKVMLTLVPT